MSNTSLGFAFSHSSVMAAQGAPLVEQEGLYVTCPQSKAQVILMEKAANILSEAIFTGKRQNNGD